MTNPCLLKSNLPSTILVGSVLTLASACGSTPSNVGAMISPCPEPEAGWVSIITWPMIMGATPLTFRLDDTSLMTCVVVLDGGVAIKNREMRVKPQHFLTQFLVKTVHHTDDNDEHGHAEHDAGNGNQGDDGNERPFGPQIAQREEQFKRQSRHAPQAKHRDGPCQRGASSRALISGSDFQIAVKRKMSFTVYPYIRRLARKDSLSQKGTARTRPKENP